MTEEYRLKMYYAIVKSLLKTLKFVKVMKTLKTLLSPCLCWLWMLTLAIKIIAIILLLFRTLWLAHKAAICCFDMLAKQLHPAFKS